MNLRTLTTFCLVVAGCGETSSVGPEPVPTRWVLEDGVANFAVLQVDFMTYRLEGGVLTKLALCDSCDLNTIPLRFTTRPPGDFGWNLFQYDAMEDTLFFGTTVWDGRGDRIVPGTLVPPDSFQQIQSQIAAPRTRHYYFSAPFQDDEWGRTKADSAWLTIRELDIAEAFARREYRVAFYLFPRSVGGFSPAEADWIVFLYTGNQLAPEGPNMPFQLPGATRSGRGRSRGRRSGGARS